MSTAVFKVALSLRPFSLRPRSNDSTKRIISDTLTPIGSSDLPCGSVTYLIDSFRLLIGTSYVIMFPLDLLPVFFASHASHLFQSSQFFVATIR